jgi:DNA-binding beta-propeller fold protein YncE
MSPAGYGGAGGNAAIVGNGSGGGATPPEQEQSLDFLVPQPGKQYVYAANPTRDTVAVIDSVSLAIAEVTPGDTPTYLATVPGQDVALVINTGSNTLSVLRTTSAGTTVSSPLPIIKGANLIAIAPGGAHAVVWFDVTQPNASALTGSLQDVSLVTLAESNDKAFTVTVGFKPTAVVFSNDGKAAFVVTSDGISELRFAEVQGPEIAPLVRIQSSPASAINSDAGAAGTDQLPEAGAPSLDGGSVGEVGAATPVNSDAARAPAGSAPPSGGTAPPVDVSVSRDGHWAIARRDGTNEILLVDLVGNASQSLYLSSPVTDLDMSDTTDTPGGDVHAFAVLRDESTLVRIAIPDGFTGASTPDTWPVPGETVGQVNISAHGKYAVLYTTAVPKKRMTVIPLPPSGTATPLSFNLQKAIRAVAIAPDEQTALVLHTKAAGNPADPGLTPLEIIDRQYGYSAVRLRDQIAVIQTTDANPDPFIITPDSKSAFVLLRDDTKNIRLAEQMSLLTFQYRDFQLGSPPNAIGALAGIDKVFVNQVHSEGRISFINWDWDDGTVESVTGFALNGRIRQ